MTSILFGIVRICSSLFKYNCLKNKKHFLEFLFRLWNLDQILNIFEKKIIVIANVLPILRTIKDLIKPFSRMRRFRSSMDSQCVNWWQIIVKSAWERFYHFFWSLCGEMTWEISPLLNFQMLGVFVNTLTADENYPFGDSGNLKFTIQMQLS